MTFVQWRTGLPLAYKWPEQFAKVTTMRNSISRVSMLLLALSLCGGQAWGQVIEEVLVTAQKRVQNAQDVPISMTSLSADDVKELRLETAADVQYQTPGLIVSYSSTNAIPNFVLRGIGLNDFTAIQSSPVAVHVDDVFYGNSTLLNFQLYDVERVEVLKGPQGTLYGRNTTGGSINFFSAMPTQEFEAGLELGYGNYEAYSVEGYVSGPLGETVSARLSGTVNNRNSGPFDHPTLGKIGEGDKFALRGQLLWDLSDDLSAHMTVFGGEDDSEGNQYQGLPTYTSDGSFGICDSISAGDGSPSSSCSFDGFGAVAIDDDDPYTLQTGVINRDKIDAFGTVAVLDYELGAATLKSVTGYSTSDRVSQEDADGSVARNIDVGYATDFSQFTQELKLASNAGGPLTWTLGLFYSTDELEAERTETDLAGLDFGRQNHAYELDTDSFAAYVHGEFEVTEGVSLMAGLRYTDEERSFTGGTINVEQGVGPDSNGDFVPSPGPLPDPNYSNAAIFDSAFLDREISFSEVSWTVGASFAMTDSAMLYGKISNGFKSGGFVGDITLQPILAEPYDKETLTAYEVGLKFDSPGGALRWNSAAFYYDYEDVILALSITGTGEAGLDFFLTNENGADADVYGFESEIWWAPTENLDIKLGATWLDTKQKSIPTSPFDVSERLDGNELPYAPDFSANGVVRYESPLSANLSGRLQVDFTARSKHWGESTNVPISKISGYTLFNASAAIMTNDGRWTASIWCKNLTDKSYFQYINDLQGLGSILRTPGLPRTYGVSLSMAM